MRIIITGFILLVASVLAIHASDNDLFLKSNIKFSSASLTVKQALEELSKIPDISVVYNGNEKFLSYQLKLPTETLTLKAALDIIKDQAPVDIIYNNNHVIVKSRQLSDSYLLQGTVRDIESDENLIGADIYLPGTSKGTVTDANGNFAIRIEPGKYKLAFRYIGYEEKEISVSLFKDQRITVLLKTMQHEIQEVNVTGTRGDVEDIETGRPIDKIDGRTVNQLNTNNVNDALHGRLNGVWTTKVSGAPGDHNKVRIRGISSIFGSTDPLYVVDGMIIPIVNFKTLGISDLNTHDVESITVLKDASSTAMYGYLGGNGVILIETKKGGGESRFNAGVKQGFQQFSGRYPLMDAEDFLGTFQRSDELLNTDYYKVIPSLDKWGKYPHLEDSLGNVIGTENFQDELFQIGRISEYYVSGQGSLKSVDYYISGNYFTHKGVVVNSNYDKYTFTSNFSKIFGEKLSLRFLYRGSWQDNLNNLDNYQGNNVIYKGINYEPGYRSTPDSFFRKPDRLHLSNYGSGETVRQLSDHMFSPDELFYKQEKRKQEITNAFNFHGIYRVYTDLMFRVNFSLALKKLHFSSQIPQTNEWSDAKYLSSRENIIVANQQYDLRYEKLVNNHSISAFVKYRNYKDNINWLVDSTVNVELESLNPEENVYLRGSQAIYGSEGSVIRRINSWVGNFNYSYKKKYTISVLTNLDHLNEGFYVDQKELFPSIALDWDMAKEDLIPWPDWVSAFHLYGNWGQAGNYPLNSLSNDLLSGDAEYSVNDSMISGVYYDNLANHFISHEKVTEINYGTRLHMFDERVILAGDYYVKKNSDLLIQRTIPIYYGGGFFYQNIGEMENKGVEISLEFTPIRQPGIIWISRLGFSTNTQKITQLYDSVPINFSRDDVLYPDFYAESGKTLGLITGYKFEGVWDETLHSDDLYGYQRYINYHGVAYLNSDTLTPNRLTGDDKVVIGNSIPRYMLNWINLFRVKNFSCEMHWYAVIGVDKYNSTRATTFAAGTNQAVSQLVSDTLRYHRDNAFYKSSFFVEDAGFVRLKTLSFRYIQPKKIADRIEIEYALSFENLITFTRYSGYDPESSIYTDNNFTDNAMDKGAYPNPQSIFLSINLRF